MKQLVIMPGGFHPFHAGHAALYQSAVQAFPGADVYVAATNDTSTRPFPFAIKEKLAKLAGVEAGHFVQVKSPFRAEEIVHRFDPNDTQLIFVRSEKDANKPPQGGGTKKDGSLSYLQPLGNDAQPLTKHAYMAYLPTVEFGPGMTSATEIRAAWPNLNEKRKTALVMSLYPATQKNPKLAVNVVKMLDTAMGAVDESVLGNQGVAEGSTETTQQQQVRAAITKGMEKWDQNGLATYQSQPAKRHYFASSDWASGQLKGINSIDPDGTVVIELNDTTTAGLVKKLASLGGMSGVKTRQLKMTFDPAKMKNGVTPGEVAAAPDYMEENIKKL